MRLRLAVLLVPLALWGCKDEPTTPVPDSEAAAAIIDAARGSGTPGFYFLTPIAANLPTYPGTFDGTLSPVVEICRRTATGCDGAPVARYTLTSGTGGTLLRVVPTSEYYRVDWPVTGLPRGVLYRIRVLLGDTELGYAEAQVPALGQTAVQLVALGIVPLGNSSRLAIRFRLEEGVGTPPPTGRQVAMEAVATRASELSLQGLSRSAYNAALAQYLATRPEFEASGVNEETSSIWARFSDGPLVIVTNNRDAPTPADADFARRPGRTPSIRAARAPGAVATRGIPAGRTTTLTDRQGNVATRPSFDSLLNPYISEIPASAQARLLVSVPDTFWVGDYEVRSRISGWLEDANYHPVAGNDASVEGLRAVNGDGFFYLSTHGGAGVGNAGESIYAVQASTPVAWDSTEEAPYVDDLEANRLVYMLNDNGARAADGRVILDLKYGITAAFVTRYMSFDHTVVLMSACGSFTEASRSLREAILAKGADVYFGWTENEVKIGASLRVALYLVDRLLGANQYETFMEDPPQRPFDWPAVLVNMEESAISTDVVTGAELQSATDPAPGPRVGLLAPSVMTVSVDEGQDALFLSGIFGSDPCGGAPTCDDGSVTVDGTPIDVKFWSPELIWATLPRTGAGSTGDVVVTVRHHESNPRRLVTWSGPITYNHTDMGSLSYIVTINARGRGDPGPIRNRPGDAPQSVTSPLFDPSRQASATFQASGTFSHMLGSCTITESWSGAGTIPAAAFADDVGGEFVGYFSHFARADYNARAALLNFNFQIPIHVVQTSSSGECPPPVEFTMAPSESIAIFDTIPLGSPGLVRAQLSSGMNMLAGSRSTSVFTLNHLVTGSANATLTWGTLTANPQYEVLAY